VTLPLDRSVEANIGVHDDVELTRDNGANGVGGAG
jgi:hypothetical protein